MYMYIVYSSTDLSRCMEGREVVTNNRNQSIFGSFLIWYSAAGKCYRHNYSMLQHKEYLPATKHSTQRMVWWHKKIMLARAIINQACTCLHVHVHALVKLCCEREHGNAVLL